MKSLLRLIWTGCLFLPLAACSIFQSDEVDPIFSNVPTGADSKQLAKQLPDSLPGDTENSRHLNTTLAPDELIDKDGAN